MGGNRLIKNASFRHYAYKFLQFNTIGTILIYMLPMLAIIGIIMPLALGMESLSLLSAYIAIPMVLSSLIYWRYIKDGN